MATPNEFNANDLSNKTPITTKEEIIEIASEYKKLDLFKDDDEENLYWYLILFLVSIFNDYDTQKLWKSFSDEIKTKNRFFPKSEFVKRINEIAEKAICFINKGEIFWRAREYSNKDLFKNKIVISLIDIINEEFPDLKIDASDIFNESLLNILSIRLLGNQSINKKIADKIDALMNKEDSFYGYDKKGSDAPPNELAKEGRANPKGISYLYATNDVNTAILEQRPQMGKMYNIATVQLIKDAKIFDFTYYPEKNNEEDYSVIADLHRISEEFSKPNFGDSIEYAPTQFLCEYIKTLGFDGIKYKSAVSNTGYNILFFDVNESTRVYDITGSKVYSVDSINIKSSQVVPMENG